MSSYPENAEAAQDRRLRRRRIASFFVGLAGLIFLSGLIVLAIPSISFCPTLIIGVTLLFIADKISP